MKIETILLDLDNVIFDFSFEYIQRMNKLIGENKFTKNHITDWDYSNLPKEYAKEFWKEAGFFKTLKPLNDALEFVPLIANKYDTYITTHSPIGGFDDKIYCLEKYFGALFKHKVIFTENKHMIIADVLLDDKPENVFDFMKKNKKIITERLAVIYDMPYNINTQSHFRVKNMKQFYELMEDLNNE